jgi:hypothetical protein
MDLSNADLQQRGEADRREVDPPIQVPGLGPRSTRDRHRNESQPDDERPCSGISREAVRFSSAKGQPHD